MTARRVDLHDDGLLWLINRVVFHPRGYALGHDPATGDCTLMAADEPYEFGNDVDEAAMLAKIRELMP